MPDPQPIKKATAPRPRQAPLVAAAQAAASRPAQQAMSVGSSSSGSPSAVSNIMQRQGSSSTAGGGAGGGSGASTPQLQAGFGMPFGLMPGFGTQAPGFGSAPAPSSGPVPKRGPKVVPRMQPGVKIEPGVKREPGAGPSRPPARPLATGPSRAGTHSQSPAPPSFMASVASAPAPSSTRGGFGDRGGARGRGGAGRGRGRGAKVQPQVMAAGVFAGGRAPTNNRPTRRGGGILAGVAKGDEDEVDRYSDEDGVLDMGAISTQGESAPTALIRHGRERGVRGDVKDVKAKAKEKRKKAKGKERARPNVEPGAFEEGGITVKPEPISPEKREALLLEEDVDGATPRARGIPRADRVDDVVMDGDEERDVDEAGQTLGAAQAVDLSESEEEEEEEMMHGDFVQEEDNDDPEEKLYMFQFPHLFPRYKPRQFNIGVKDEPESSAAAAATAVDAKPDIKPDIKPTAAQLRGVQRPHLAPEGRIGTLVVMKSGKVKMVMGDDIVMNVAPGVPSTFLQHLIHVDRGSKSLKVIGEVNKHFTVTPDIDRLLHQLWLHDGQTPGDVERQEAERRQRMWERNETRSLLEKSGPGIGMGYDEKAMRAEMMRGRD